MSVDTATVKKIASLARIAITEEDATRLAPELENILGWIEQLGEVDTQGVAPMTAVIPNQLRLRDDVVNDGGIRDLLMQKCAAGRTWLLHGAQGDRIMTDLTTLGIAAIRDGVRDGQFKAREVAEAFNAKVAKPTRSTPSWSRPRNMRSPPPMRPMRRGPLAKR